MPTPSRYFSIVVGPLLAAVALLAAACDGASPSLPPTATAAPTATSTPAIGPPEPSGLRALAHVQALSVDIGPRPAGSEEELEAVAYAAAQLESYGYAVEVQDFPFTVPAGYGAALAVISPSEQALRAAPLAGSAAGSVSAPLVDAGLGRAEDFPPAPTGRGAVALVQRGEVLFVETVANAVRAGASAVIISNNEPGLPVASLEAPAPIPVVAVSQEDGDALRSLLAGGAVSVALGVGPLEGTAHNVIGRPPSGRCETMSGAHLDSVAASPGANDNASGAAVVLELARTVAAAGLPGDHCFALFGAEEPGLRGSAYLVSGLTPEERDELRAMLNFDVVGGGAEGLLFQEDSPLADEAAVLAGAEGLAAQPADLPPGFQSDHASFVQADIPAIWFATPPFDLINSPLDTIDHVRAAPLDDAATLGLLLLSALEQP